MAAYPLGAFYRPPSTELASQHHRYFEEDDGSILDDHIFESGLDMSPVPHASRRESYAMSAALFSPKTEDWHHVDMQHSMSNRSMTEQSQVSFAQQQPVQQQQQHQQPQSVGFLPRQHWSLNSLNDAAVPMQQYEGIPVDFEHHGPVSFEQMHTQTPFVDYTSQDILLSPSGASAESAPDSPQKDWFLDEGMESRNMPKRMRPHSPGLRSHSPFLRRDGIRKKNARFEIPAERNLHNIDQLIAHSTDEQEVKELKQQKRLLRNRQAALDSRQRKKQHTERLEDEKKHYTSMITELEEELADAKVTLDAWSHERQQMQQYIDTLRAEKDEMIRVHTLETGDLRKRVAVLTEHVQKSEDHAAAMASSSAVTQTNYSDIDSLTIDGAWDSISFFNENPATTPAAKTENAQGLILRNDAVVTNDSEKPAASGILLMILLFGAFVASRGTSPNIPRMSDDVRAASASLLENVFKDAGVQQSSTMPNELDPVTSHPMGQSWPTMDGHDSMHDFTSSLGSFAGALSMPSEDQKHDQIFSLTPAQYGAVASPEHLHNLPTPTTEASKQRRNLADTLAAMASDSQHSAAEVYTRSLLWDQVPSDVVRNFARLVSDHAASEEGTPRA